LPEIDPRCWAMAEEAVTARHVTSKRRRAADTM
jgi:hypothetical protein